MRPELVFSLVVLTLVGTDVVDGDFAVVVLASDDVVVAVGINLMSFACSVK